MNRAKRKQIATCVKAARTRMVQINGFLDDIEDILEQENNSMAKERLYAVQRGPKGNCKKKRVGRGA